MKGRAIVAGAGIGGLAAGLALLRKGWQVRIYEQSDDIRVLGAAIYIWENGLRVLETLGCYDEVIRDGHRGFAFEIRDCDGAIIDPGVLPEGIRVYTVPRKQLLDGLRNAAVRAGVEIVVNSTISGARPDGTGFRVDALSVSTSSCDVLARKPAARHCAC